jgi:hypothetical protein
MNTIKSGFKYVFNSIFSKPDESPNAHPGLVKLVWILRVSISQRGDNSGFFDSDMRDTAVGALVFYKKQDH